MAEFATHTQTVFHDSLADGEGSLFLELEVDDAETVRALSAYPSGEARDEFALAALRIGVLALRHAGRSLDGDVIAKESTRLLESVRTQLDEHSRRVHEELKQGLQEYFDPKSGRFQERLERLVRRDGELEQILSRQIGSDDSQLCKTLTEHIGEHSPLMKLLSPDESKGVLAAMREVLDQQLKSQRDRILNEFSLHNPESSLSRLIERMSDSNGQLRTDLKQQISEVMKEFSLKDEGSTLSVLVRNVDTAQQKIRQEFSLDNKESGLARMKMDLMELLGKYAQENNKFQEEVKVALAKLVTTREAAARSTRHGFEFEDAVCEFIGREAESAGDVATATGNEVGRIRNCKVGDCVVELGPDSPAPSAKIAIEAKELSGYTLARAREEIETARQNRGAQMGLFIFSHKTTPAGFTGFRRLGNDIFVTWNAEDPMTDTFLKAGLATARALCIRAAVESEAQTADLNAIEVAILEIEKRTGNLDEVRKYAETIKNSSGKILDRVRIDREALDKQVALLHEKLVDLRQTFA